MSIALYFVMMTMMPPEGRRCRAAGKAIRKSLAELGPMKSTEIKLLLDLARRCSVLGDRRRAAQVRHHHDDHHRGRADVPARLRHHGLERRRRPRIPWGTIVLFGVGISLGTALLQTKAATWLANIVVAEFGLKNATALFDPRRDAACF